MMVGVLKDALPRPVGFVLGGGGSLGATQVGMLQALAEYEVRPDLVVGTSVGAINGVVLASDPRGAANRLSHLWPTVTREMVFPGGLLSQLRTLRHGHTHLFPNDALVRAIDAQLGPDASFDQLALPFGAVTLDVTSGRPHVVTQGALGPALLASSAIPGIFPPVEVDGRVLYDGGVVANVPLTQALDMGARSLVVLEATFPGQLPHAPTTIVEALFYTVLISMRVQAQLEAPLAATRVPVVYLPGPEIHRVSPLDFDHTSMLMEGAYAASRAFLASLTVDGPGLYGLPSGR